MDRDGFAAGSADGRSMPPRDAEDRLSWSTLLPRKSFVLPWEIRAHPPEFRAAHPDVSDARGNAAELVQHDGDELLCDYGARAGVPTRDEGGTQFRQSEVRCSGRGHERLLPSLSEART